MFSGKFVRNILHSFFISKLARMKNEQTDDGQENLKQNCFTLWSKQKQKNNNKKTKNKKKLATFVSLTTLL